MYIEEGGEQVLYLVNWTAMAHVYRIWAKWLFFI